MSFEQAVRIQSGFLGPYEEHLRRNCGLTAGSVGLFVWHVARFLATRYGDRRPNPEALKPQDAAVYVLGLSPRWKPNTRKGAVTALRSYLRWLQMCGRCAPELVDSVPTVSSSRFSGIPAAISPHQLGTLLETFDRNKPTGLRDYAAALCMARLGLRVGEVAQLTLDDIDWREGVISLPMRKARRRNALPLPREVGDAMVAYIRRGRPRTPERHIFVSHRRQKVTPVGKAALRHAVRMAFIKGHLNTPSKGTHILRHTAATQWLRSGASLKEIADTLGHQSLDTTAIYAKVDVAALQTVAMPWPQEASR